MSKKLTQQEINERIKETFSKNPSSIEIKKIKNLAQSRNIKLTTYKNLFCKKCLTFFNPTNCSVRIKKPYKIITCLKCNYKFRKKLRNEGFS